MTTATQVIEVPLANGRGVALIDECDAALVLKSKWSLANVGYAMGYRKGKNILMHRLILDAQPGQEIDHINGSKLDNRRCNLRFATRTQNNANVGRRRHGRSGFKGITRLHGSNRNKWIAQIACEGRREIIGYYATDIEAAKAYDSRARELFGEFAKTNF